MLSIGKIAAGPQATAYYTDQVARGRDDYYAGEGEEPGRWVGAGASALGLDGGVAPEGFAELLDGGGVRRPLRPDAVAGFDLTFRAPKSVSVLWAVGDADVVAELRSGHDAAVSEALNYLERVACRARRGRDGRITVQGRGFAAAAFFHRASRAGDPLVHTHVVAGNLTQGPDGRWTALDARHLYRHAKTAGYMYQAALRRELTERLGVQWLPVEHGVADLAGVPREVIEHFSQRRREILEHMAERSVQSATAAQVAALETRRAKDQPHADRLRELWRARAIEHGFDGAAAARVIGHARVVPAPVSVDPETLTEQVSTFGRPEVLQALAEAQPAGAYARELAVVADDLIRRFEVRRLQDGPAAGGAIEERYSTIGLLRAENELLAIAERRRGAGAAVVPRETVERAVRGRALGPDQEAMVGALCGRGDGVAVVRSPAGAGKTFALDAAREAWQAENVRVFGCALSARAALELTDTAGIDATTVARLREDLQRGRELPRRSVLVVDEAGMVGTRDVAGLAEAAERTQSKLVLVGDDRQIPEIDAGGAFRALAQRDGAVALSEVRRQVHPWDRAALNELRSGEVERWARAYRDHGNITVARSARDARAALVNDWSRAPGDALMIAARRDDVRDLNQRGRELLQASGRIDREELTVGDRSFAVGDRVIGTRNDRHLGILNGQRGTVRGIDHEHQALRVELDVGEPVELGPTYLHPGHLDHAYAITAHRAQGATVDRTFVLGSDELYREWGYTALSRHRHEARFYVARTDLDTGRGHERDLLDHRDADIEDIARLLRRTGAKELATSQLRTADRDNLERERERLRDELAVDPAPRRDASRQAIAERHVAESERTLKRLAARREALSWLDRSQRRDLDQQLDRARERYGQLLDAHRSIATAERRDDANDQRWAARHGEDANRLLAVDDELAHREKISRAAERDISALQQHNPLDRGVEQFDRGYDLGPDLGR